MDFEIQKNCLIKGNLKSYCLLCEEGLTSKLSISLHIQSHTHKSSLESSTYLEKYKEDGIRQVRRGYYCEFCNVLLVIKPKVAYHIDEDSHKRNRGMFLLKEIENGVLAFNKVFIENKAWHGLIEDTCAICDVDTKDADQHIQELTHIFNLIQLKLEFYDDNIYRKTDRDFFNCLICNLILHMETFTTHFKSGSHERRYMACRELYAYYINSEIANGQNANKTTNIDGCNITTMNFKHESETAVKELTDNKSEMSQGNKGTPKTKNLSAVELENSGGASDLNRNKTAKETETNDTTCEGAAVKNDRDNLESELDQAEIYQPQEAFMIAITFAKKNGIKYKHGSQSAYCRSCDVKISSTLKRMKEHVASPAHQHRNNLPKNTRPNVLRVPLFSFIKQKAEINILDEPYVIINKNICVNFLGYHMITDNNNVVRCQLCDLKTSKESLVLHTITKLHRHKMECTVKVVVDSKFNTEFVREIRPNLYHCGYCNILSEDLEELEHHCMSSSHKKEKIFCFNLLRCIMSILDL